MYDSKKHFSTLFDSYEREFGFHASSEEEFTSWQERFRTKLRDALGLTNMERDFKEHEPHAVMSASEDLGTYLRESWHLWVEPTVALPFYLLRPKQRKGPLPLVLAPHGHNHPHIYVGIGENDDEKQSILEGERDIACQAVEQGYLVIAPTTRGFGETRTEEDREAGKTSSCRIQLMHDLLVGRTPIGDRVWDMSRLIDWAMATQDVDSERVAMTGNSGGGTITVFAAACDPRITVAVPSSYFCTFQGSIGSIHHCDCNYVPGMLRLGEMYDVAGLIAPRPFMAIAGKDDQIFPLEHVRFAFDKLKHIYDVAGVPEKCKLFVGDGGHRYYKAGSWPFIKQHFGL